MRYLLSLFENGNIFKIKNLMVISLAFTLTFLAGCLPERKFQDNRFTSTYPKMSINLGKDFQYLGTDTYTPSNSSADNEYYFFIHEKTEKRTIKKAVYVMFLNKRPGGKYYGQLRDIANRQDVFSYGAKLIDGNEYEYITMHSYGLDRHVIDWLNQKGYILPRCYLIRMFLRLHHNNLIETVVYIEDIALSGFECDQWKTKWKLNDKQKEYIDAFAIRADKILQISNP